MVYREVKAKMKQPKNKVRLEIIVGDPENPKFHTVTTVECLLETVELLTSLNTLGVPKTMASYQSIPPLIPPLPCVVKKESPEILRIKSDYESERDHLRADYEAKIRQNRIDEEEQIGNEKSRIINS